MSSNIITSAEDVFSRGTKVKFKRDTVVSVPNQDGNIGEMVVPKGTLGEVSFVFPYISIHLESGEEIKLHKSIRISDELGIISRRPKLSLVI